MHMAFSGCGVLPMGVRVFVLTLGQRDNVDIAVAHAAQSHQRL